MRKTTGWAALLAAASVAGCVAVHKTNLSVTQADATPCPARRQLQWLCIADVPPAGYLGINAYGHGTEDTFVTVRLAPERGVTAHWAGPELAIVDPGSGQVVQRVALDPRPVTGGSTLPGVEGYVAVGYGPLIETQFRMARRLARAELRFPPVALADRQVPIPAFQLEDGMRIPMVVPILANH